MRSFSSLAWVALLPLLAACASETGPSAEGGKGDAPAAGARSDGPADNGTEGASPVGATPPPSPSASSPSLAACTAQPSCTGTTSPELAPQRSFNHYLGSVTAASGPAFHRGRDQMISVGDPQWVIGHMTYTYIDKDLLDEDVDIFVERGCAGTWEKLGSTRTTDNSGSHASVEGVDDNGGRVFFQIPSEKELAPGRHRIRLVVAADQTSTDLLIDVMPKGSPIVVSDVDGTLTDSETAEYPALLEGVLPGAQPHAADALSTLAAKGYHIVYLTARPEWLTGRTHEFLQQAGFPPGVVHTTSGETGAINSFAAAFKSAELALLESHGHVIKWAFGNQPSDTDAYDAAQINPVDQRVFLRVSDPHGGRRIEAYSEILPAVTATPAICK
jgi:hypothetical protein